jgi:hypothetical protein
VAVSDRAVNVRIDELVLHGFDPRDRLAIGAAVERELARLMASEGDPGRLAGADRVDGGSFGVARDTAPGAVGVKIARAIHGGLGAPRGGGR